MSSQNSIGVKGIVILLVLIIGIPLGAYFGQQKSINYKVNGTEVTATVINVYTWRVRGTIRKTVTVTYEDKDGKLITAKAINAGDVIENQTIIGKVIPENPEEVFLEPALWLTILVNGVAGLLFLGGLLVLFGMVWRRKTDKQMSAQGKVTDAVIMKREFIGDTLFVDVGFKDENGIHRFASCSAPIYLDSKASTCTIRYVVKSEKKVICEIV